MAWYDSIVGRYAEFPDESLESRAAALSMSPGYLRAITSSDAFRSLLASKGLDATPRGPVADEPPSSTEDASLRLPAVDPEPSVSPQTVESLGPSPASEASVSTPDTNVRHVQRPGNYLKDARQYTHAGLIDALIARPQITRSELAVMFGMNVHWVYKVLASEAFREEFRKRKAEIVDPTLALSVEETFGALVAQAADVAAAKLSANDGRMAARLLDVGAKFFSGIHRNTAPAVQNFIAIVPGKAPSAAEWAQSYGPAALPVPSSDS